MTIKDATILFFASLILGWAIAETHPKLSDPMALGEATIKAQQIVTPTTLNVQNKVALFIGDSHTSNHKQGWQKRLCDSVGFKMINASVGGKTTYWMIEQAVYKITDKVDYCFIYGGANDMYNSHITPQEAVDNIKAIAKLCQHRAIKCIVLTGFDPVKCTRTPNKSYAGKYAKFQNLLLTQYMEGAQVVDTRVVDRRDCWDELCHMAPSGHKKIAEKVIKDLGFEKI